MNDEVMSASAIHTMNLGTYTSIRQEYNFLTEESNCIKELKQKIACLELENYELRQQMRDLKELVRLKPQIDSLLNYYKIDLFTNLN